MAPKFALLLEVTEVGTTPVFKAQVALSFRGGENLADLDVRRYGDVGDPHDAQWLARDRGDNPAVAGFAHANALVLKMQLHVGRAAFLAVPRHAGKFIDEGSVHLLARLGERAGMMRRRRIDAGRFAGLTPERIGLGCSEDEHCRCSRLSFPLVTPAQRVRCLPLIATPSRGMMEERYHRVDRR